MNLDGINFNSLLWVQFRYRENVLTDSGNSCWLRAPSLCVLRRLLPVFPNWTLRDVGNHKNLPGALREIFSF